MLTAEERAGKTARSAAVLGGELRQALVYGDDAVEYLQRYLATGPYDCQQPFTGEEPREQHGPCFQPLRQ